MAYKLTEQDSMRASFAKNLKRLMYASDITQKELSEKLNVTSSTVSAWCNGKKMPRPEKIDKMCEIFDVETSELTGDVKNRAVKREYENGKFTFTFNYSDEPITINDIVLAKKISTLDAYRKSLVMSIIETVPEQTKEG